MFPKEKGEKKTPSIPETILVLSNLVKGNKFLLAEQ